MKKLKFLAFVPLGMLLMLLLTPNSTYADPPGAKADTYAVSENGELERIGPGLLLNDQDPDGDQLILSTIPQSEPAYGDLTLNPDGGFLYVHDGSESTEDYFVYEVCDDSEQRECSTALVSLVITPVNDPPVAVDDPETTTQGGTVSKSAPGLLANDSDIEGNALSIYPLEPVSPPAYGTVELLADGSFTYTHDNSETVADSFEYQVCDDGEPQECDVGEVLITISNINNAPDVVDDEYAVEEGESLLINAPGILDNDTDPDNDSISINPAYPTSGPNHGQLTLGSNGSFAYVHNGSETVEDLFTYRACDTGTPKLCSSGTVRLSITAVNDAPVAVPDSANVLEGGTLSVAAPGLLATDTDAEGDALMVSVEPVVAPQHGALMLAADGSYLYVHDGSETTSDSFIYEVCDDGEPVACDSAVVTIVIDPVNDVVQLDLNGAAEGVDFEAVFSTNAGPALIVAPTLTVSDPDDEILAAATVALEAVPDKEAEVLSAISTETNITTAYNPTTGVLTLTGPDSLTNFQKVLRTVRYTNSALPPDPTPRIATFIILDSHDASAPVNSQIAIQNPGLTLEITPNPQLISSGSDAIFTIELENIGNVALTELVSFDALVADCDGRDLGALNAGETKVFECKQERVTSSFSHEIMVSGKDPLGGAVSAHDTAIVSLKDANIAIAVTPNQQTVRRGGNAELMIVVLNTSTVTALSSVHVEVPAMPACDRTIGTIAPGSSYGYRCEASEIENDFIAVATAVGTNTAEQEEVQASASAAVRVFDLAVTISAEPDVIETKSELVTFQLEIENLSASIPVSLESILVSPFGNVADAANPNIESTTCSDLDDIVAGASDSCLFEVILGPPASSFVARATVTASAEEAGEITATDDLLIRIMTQFMLPLVSNQMFDEPNDIPCESYMMLLNSPYHFYAEDVNDWYLFGLADEMDVEIQLTSFAPESGQIAVWAGESCDSLRMVTVVPITGESAEVTLPDLEGGHYYVQIWNSGAPDLMSRYTLELVTK